MGRKHKSKNSSAQHGSGNSILGVLGTLRGLRILGWKTKNENSPAQRDSKMSNGRLSGVFCRWQGGRLSESRPAQRDSGISKLGMGVMGVMELMGRKHKSKNCSAQRGSGNSILGVMGILRSLGILGWKTVRQGVIVKTENHKNRMRPAQRDSIMSNGRLSGVSCWPHGQKGIFTIQIKNINDFFRGKWGNGSMSKMQNISAQRYSIMSNLKIATENSLPQRHFKMSNGQLSGELCCPHGQKEMSTMQIKNIGYRFMADGCPFCYAGRMGKPVPFNMVPISILKTSPYRPLDSKSAPAGRYFKNSNLGLFQQIEVCDGDAVADDAYINYKE